MVIEILRWRNGTPPSKSSRGGDWNAVLSPAARARPTNAEAILSRIAAGGSMSPGCSRAHSCAVTVSFQASFGFQELPAVGKECFVPRCDARYKTCTEKLSLFAMPKEDHLKGWRDAIPRKGRLLQPTDFVCERDFESKCVSRPRKAV